LAGLVIAFDLALLIVFLAITGWFEAGSAVPAVLPPTPTLWTTPTPVQAVAPTPSARPLTSYVVKPGDVLADIATRFGISVQDIVKANGLSDPNAIRAGQSLTIPVPSAR
jgi:LysM repeat protein